MNIDQELELPFTYSWKLFTILVIIIVVLLIFLIFYNFFKKAFNKIINKVSLPYAKAWYLRKLQMLLNSVANNKINIRDAYLRLSNIIREFIERATGINVLTLSKKEIRDMKMDNLSILMEEYYPPEFSKESRGDVINSIKRAMEVINKWK